MIKSFLSAKLIYFIAAAVFATLVGAAYFYYQDSQERLMQASIDLVNMERDLEALRAQQAAQERDMKLVREQQQLLATNLDQIREETRDLERIFNEHDLEALASAKPRLIERRINSATRQVLEELEEISRGD